MKRMPVLFVGHGSPMNIMLDNTFTRSLRYLAGKIPKPEAVCVVSAHWQTRGTFVACQENLRQIYDFYGFPEELYKVHYEPAGYPKLALRAVALMHLVDPIVRCNDEWGHDHAGWSVLKHLYPAADVPVFLVSADMTAPPERHVQLAQSLAPLRDEGVLILASGNIVHNLRDADFINMYAPSDRRGISFDTTVKEALLSEDIDTLVNYRRLGEPALYSVPTTDHYLPLLYAAGLREEGESLSFICEMFQNRSVSMRSFLVGGE
jgi:4,5-DOPA dioxygenase extradiol